MRRGETYLSLNCLDLFEIVDRVEQLRRLRGVLKRKMTIRSRHRLSIINVGYTKRDAVAHGYSLDFRHRPEADDETHCGLDGFEYNDEVIQDLIAECVTDVVSAFEPL